MKNHGATVCRIYQDERSIISQKRVWIILFFADSFKSWSSHHIEYIIQFITINKTQEISAINVKYFIISQKVLIIALLSFGTWQVYVFQLSSVVQFHQGIFVFVVIFTVSEEFSPSAFAIKIEEKLVKNKQKIIIIFFII